jgi:preprotein translocase subunit SecA
MLNVFSKVFGTRNDRVVKKYKNIANEITNLEAIYEAKR